MVKNLRKKKKGFTLIELIIVIAIIGVLAAVAIPKFGNASKDAKEKADLANAKNIANAATMAIAEGDSLGTGDSNGFIDVDGNTTLKKYLQSIPKAQTGGSFYIKLDGNGVLVYSGESKTLVYPK